MTSFFEKLKKGMEINPSASLRINGERPSTSLGTSPEFIEGRSRTIKNLPEKESAKEPSLVIYRVQEKKIKNEIKKVNPVRSKTPKASADAQAPLEVNGSKKKYQESKPLTGQAHRTSNGVKGVEKKKEGLKKIKVKEENNEAPEVKVKEKKSLEPTRQNFVLQSLGGPEGQLTVDVYQTDKEIVIQSAIAGIRPEDLDISIENDMVIIRGDRERPFEKDERNYFYQECYWGRFSREIVIPDEIDGSRIEASIKQGILTIRMPKIEREKVKKIIVGE